MIPAERAVRAWVNAQPQLAGEGMPLSNGAYLRSQRSPGDGCYAVLASSPGTGGLPAEAGADLAVAAITALIYGGTTDTAEAAAVAYMTAVEELTGMPAQCGAEPYRILVADHISGPAAVQPPADAGEAYCFQVSAEFLLARN
jgi:hypothetical protein